MEIVRITAPGAAGLLSALIEHSFDEVWTPESMAALLADPGGVALVGCDAGGTPVGIGLARIVIDEAEILALAVMPEARRGGRGRALLQGLVDHCITAGAATLFLEVAVDNVAALALYQGAGFREVGRRAAYYRGRVDAIVMRLDLTAAASTA